MNIVSTTPSGREFPGRAASRGRILIVNPNSNPAVNLLMEGLAEQVLPPGVTARVIHPTAAPPAIQTLADRRLAEPMAIKLLAENKGYDAYVMACFDDIALVQARRFLQVPVVGAVEASVAMARLVASSFAVVTTVETAVPGIRAVLEGLGADGQCNVRAAGVGVSEAAGAGGDARIEAAIEQALNIDGAGAIILGSAGLSGRAKALKQRHGVPVIDAMEAALLLALAGLPSG